MRTKHWSKATPRGDPTAVLMGLRRPVEGLLSSALRRVAHRRPEVFERLGVFADATFLIAPDGSPVGFRLTPKGALAGVQVRRRDDSSPCAARIEGPLEALLGLFDGSQDADAAFFSRAIRVSGDIEAVMALHNTLEAAELTLADLLGLPAPAGELANAALSFVRQAALAKAGWA